MKPKFPISDIEFGEMDGKNEARNPKFATLFYNGGGYYNKLSSNPLKTMVIGRKGTGKTILVRYFQSVLSKERNVITKFIVAEDFANEKLNTYDYALIKDEERSIFWRYVILKELATLVSVNEGGVFNKKLKAKLSSLINDINLSISELVSETGDNVGIGIGMSSASINASVSDKSTTKYSPGKYFNKLPDLTKTLMDLMKRAHNSYYIFFDDLDEIKVSSFETETNNSVAILAKLLMDFISSLSYVNDMLLDIRSESRIITTLRKDVNDQMNLYGNNINKIVTDNGVPLNWYSPLIQNSPEKSDLGKLVLHKIKVSVPEYKNLDDKELFDMIFVKASGKTNPFKYIVERGFGRPRDVIRYLNIVKESFPDSLIINYDMVKDCQSDYCSWFYSELQNEIHILENSNSINKVIDLIKKNGKTIFSYNELAKCMEQNNDDFKDIINLKEDLKSLYQLGAIGNHEKKKGRKPIIEYSYRGGTFNPNFEKNFVVHQGLRSYLSIG